MADNRPNLEREVPIPPLSVVQIVHTDRNTPAWSRAKGRIFRVGYYSKQDGLDCIWLVNGEGKYEQATDHEFLYRYFDVISFARNSNWFGRRRPKIGPIRLAELSRQIVKKSHPSNPKVVKQRRPKGTDGT
jgi:hypothetical protein